MPRYKVELTLSLTATDHPSAIADAYALVTEDDTDRLLAVARPIIVQARATRIHKLPSYNRSL